MGSSQREAIMRSLNEDVQNLVSQYEPNDPSSVQLLDELNYCNDIVHDFTARLEEEGNVLIWIHVFWQKHALRHEVLIARYMSWAVRLDLCRVEIS